MQALPWIITAAGALKQGSDQKSADSYNAKVMNTEGVIASTQGYEAEAQKRRDTAQVLGKMEAAAGQAGAGYGGSVGRVLGQSAVNAELDALNIRYKAALQKWAYTTQGANLVAEGKNAQTSSWLRAGSALLRGYSSNYAGADLG